MWWQLQLLMLSPVFWLDLPFSLYLVLLHYHRTKMLRMLYKKVRIINYACMNEKNFNRLYIVLIIMRISISFFLNVTELFLCLTFILNFRSWLSVYHLPSGILRDASLTVFCIPLLYYAYLSGHWQSSKLFIILQILFFKNILFMYMQLLITLASLDLNI